MSALRKYGSAPFSVAVVHGAWVEDALLHRHRPRVPSRALSRVLPAFRFILLKGCGHTPWCERFYAVLKDELPE